MRNSNLIVVTLALASLLSGCASLAMPDVSGWWPPWGKKSGEQAASLASACDVETPSRYTLLPLDNRWVSGRVDCASGNSTQGFQLDVRRKTTVKLRFEIVNGSNPVSVVLLKDGQFKFYLLDSTVAPMTELSIPEVAPSMALLVHGVKAQDFRLRVQRQDAVRATTQAPPPEPTDSAVEPTPESATEEVLSPETDPSEFIEPPPPGSVLANATAREGDPVSRIRLDRGSVGGARVGQLGRLIVDGEKRSSFCLDEVDSGSSMGRLYSRPPAADLTGDANVRIEVSTATTRAVDLLRSTGSPVFELELRSGSDQCLFKGQRGALIRNGKTVAEFRLERLVTKRAWARLDVPISKAEAEGAKVILRLESGRTNLDSAPLD